MPKKIIDVCCGNRMFHYNKLNPDVLFMDNRLEPLEKLSNGAYFSVNPDIIADFTNMPFPDESFSLVIFDPPHLRCGEKSFMYKKYGTLGANWKETLISGFNECFRILVANGTLVFKWSDSYKPLKEILALAPQTPIITHTTGLRSGAKQTHFCVFFKSPMQKICKECQDTIVPF